MELLGQTRDDAAGEAYDKVAKLLGLGYPGGPILDRLAKEGDPKAVPLPRPMASRRTLAMSFSGLKTAVARHLEVEGLPESEAELADLAASFQAVVAELLVRKSLAACAQREIPRLVLGGGVAANRGLRALAAERSEQVGVTLTIPPLASCTDNGAMIAYAGARKLARGERDDETLGVYSRSPLVERGKFPKRGARPSAKDRSPREEAR
jgi:N6-L-threonylcarbamoyladenine synthase